MSALCLEIPLLHVCPSLQQSPAISDGELLPWRGGVPGSGWYVLCLWRAVHQLVARVCPVQET